MHKKASSVIGFILKILRISIIRFQYNYRLYVCILKLICNTYVYIYIGIYNPIQTFDRKSSHQDTSNPKRSAPNPVVPVPKQLNKKVQFRGKKKTSKKKHRNCKHHSHHSHHQTLRPRHVWRHRRHCIIQIQSWRGQNPNCGRSEVSTHFFQTWNSILIYFLCHDG